MELLKFSMPPFARVSWASKAIKEKWEPIVNRASMVYTILERESVVHGLRKCYTEHISPHNMLSRMQQLSKQGLSFVPMKAVGSYSGFSHYHPPVLDGQPWAYYGAVGKDAKDAYAFAYYSSETQESHDKPINHTEIGKLLGYPECCQNFFDTVWRAGYIDPMWQAACNCKPEHVKKKTDTTIRLKSSAPFQGSVMMRYINLRLTPHMPCSLDCEPSVKMADDWIQLGKDIKVDGLDELLEILQFPIEWDCLKGIAYISTPLFKIETNSMTCYPKYTVQREGTTFPDDAPKGLKFPWNESYKYKKAKKGSAKNA